MITDTKRALRRTQVSPIRTLTSLTALLVLFVVALLRMAFAMASEPESLYIESQEFAGHPWGARIEEIEGLEYLSADIVPVVIQSGFKQQVDTFELSTYYKPEDDFRYSDGDVRIESVQYLFCSLADTPDLCGTIVTYNSGYIVGLTHRQMFGELGVEDTRTKWRRARSAHAIELATKSAGYIDGLSGIPHPPKVDGPCTAPRQDLGWLRWARCRLRQAQSKI